MPKYTRKNRSSRKGGDLTTMYNDSVNTTKNALGSTGSAITSSADYIVGNTKKTASSVGSWFSGLFGSNSSTSNVTPPVYTPSNTQQYTGGKKRRNRKSTKKNRRTRRGKRGGVPLLVPGL